MANQENTPTKKPKLGTVAVLSVVAVVLFVVLIGLIGSMSGKPKTSPKNEVAQNKNAKALNENNVAEKKDTQTSTENKEANKKDIADVLSISNWQFSSKQNFHDYSFVLQNVGNLSLGSSNAIMWLYVYDKDNVLLKRTNSSISGNLSPREKVRVSGTLVGDISTAAWGKITLGIKGEEYSSEKWKLNFSGGKAILGNTAQNIEQSTKEETQQIAKQTTGQLPEGNSILNNKDSKSAAAQALDDEYQKKMDELGSLTVNTARQYAVTKNPSGYAELSRLEYEKAALDVKYGKSTNNIVERLVISATYLAT